MVGRMLSRISPCCALIAALVGCSGSVPGDITPGSVPKGGACHYTIDCAPVPDGGIPGCECPIGQSGNRRCNAVFPIDVVVVCGNGVSCSINERCTTSGCVPPSASAGESCDGSCLPGLYCNAANLCETPHAAGEPCDVDHLQSTCVAPAFCDTTTSICVEPRGVGEACDPNDIYHTECASGLDCSLVSATCVAPQPDGAACLDDTYCLSFYCSPTGRCATKPCRG